MEHYSLSARIVKAISVKDVFVEREEASLSPYIQEVMPDLFQFTLVEPKQYTNSIRELKLSSNEKLDIVFSDAKFIGRKPSKSAKRLCIVENQFGSADTTHANKIFNYITFLLQACPNVKELHYYWLAEDFSDEAASNVYNTYSSLAESVYSKVSIIFHRVQYSVEDNNGDTLVSFKELNDVYAHIDILKLPYKYREHNEMLAASGAKPQKLVRAPFSDRIKAAVIKAYLFDGMSHRAIQSKILRYGYTDGFVTKHLLMEFNITCKEKSMFAGKNIVDAINSTSSNDIKDALIWMKSHL